MKEFWDSRYSQTEYVFGEAPNAYFQAQLQKLEPKTLLLPAEGEGRNAIFAAKQGWTVFAFDQSPVAQQKALQLAQKNNVSIHYQVGSLDNITYPNDYFDALGLIYAHFPSSLKATYHKQLLNYLRTDGIIIFEAFSKQHLAYNAQNPNVGGPRDSQMLFSIDEIKHDFAQCEIIELLETEVVLNEGTGHIGTGHVVRFVGKKR